MAGYKLTEFTFSTSYTTGGESLDPRILDHPSFAVFAFPKSGYVFEWNASTKKLLAYWGDNNNASDGPLIEVPAATNLSTIGAVTVLLLPKV